MLGSQVPGGLKWGGQELVFRHHEDLTTEVQGLMRVWGAWAEILQDPPLLPGTGFKDGVGPCASPCAALPRLK
jgi:hypothetical protein